MKGFLHNFNENETHDISGIPEAGRLSIGQPMDGNSHPRSLEYFRPYKADKSVMAAFKKVYGEKPKEIDIVFLSSDPLHVCRTQYILRCGSRKYAWGDGQTFTHWQPYNLGDPSKGKNVTTVVQSEDERDTLMTSLESAAAVMAKSMKIGKSSWSIELRLQFWLPDVPVVGLWKFRTGGEATSIKNISSTFKTVLMAAKTVQFLPFKLRVSMHNADNFSRSKYPIVELIPPSTSILEASNHYGNKLFDLMFRNKSGMLRITEADVANAVAQLGAGTDLSFNSAPVIPEPDTLTKVKAENHFAGTGDHMEGNADISTEGSMAESLATIKGSKDWEQLTKAWNNAKPYHGSISIRKWYAVKGVELCTQTVQLDGLVKNFKEFHDDGMFKGKVIQKRSLLKKSNS